SLARDRLDWLRAVTYVGYKFSDKILVNSEVELEHASTGEGAEEKGEISIEFAYLDFLLHPRISARAGLLLVPVGWINEIHEPPTFLGALRPDVETFLLPSTWSAGGFGIHGELGSGISYRAYALEGLRAKADPAAGVEGFNAEEGVRGGRQGGCQGLGENCAGVARADWRSGLGFTTGASVYSGGSGQGDTAPGPTNFTARTTVIEGHAEYRARGAWLRALYAHVSLAQADLVDAANAFIGDQSVGSEMFGWYGEAGYDLARLVSRESSLSFFPFARYEAYDTQRAVPA